MKILIITLGLLAFFQFDSFAQTDFSLEAGQVMLMTGKGKGQDGSINPYYGEDCIAVIENFGKNPLSLRIQEDGEILNMIPLAAGETLRLELLADHELYFDAELDGEVNVRLDYEKMDPQ